MQGIWMFVFHGKHELNRHICLFFALDSGLKRGHCEYQTFVAALVFLPHINFSA